MERGKGLLIDGLSQKKKTYLFSNRSTLSWLATVGSRRYPPAKIKGAKRVNYSNLKLHNLCLIEQELQVAELEI